MIFQEETSKKPLTDQSEFCYDHIYQPTQAAPGSEEKIAVLAERAELARRLKNELPLFHPGDSRRITSATRVRTDRYA